MTVKEFNKFMDKLISKGYDPNTTFGELIKMAKERGII